MPDNTVLRFQAAGRRPAALATLGGIWVVILLGYFAMDIRWWILLPFALLTIPAVVDAARGRNSSLLMDDDLLSWRSSNDLSDEVLLRNVEKVGIRIRLDLSRRVRVYLTDGRIVRIPPDCTPPGSLLERAFSARGIKVDREFFGG